MNLCCKSMMVYGEAFESDPDFQAGLTDFWCQRTMKAQGPDNDDVFRELVITIFATEVKIPTLKR